jgi:hypothetical protein
VGLSSSSHDSSSSSWVFFHLGFTGGTYWGLFVSWSLPWGCDYRNVCGIIIIIPRFLFFKLGLLPPRFYWRNVCWIIIIIPRFLYLLLLRVQPFLKLHVNIWIILFFVTCNRSCSCTSRSRIYSLLWHFHMCLGNLLARHICSLL